VGAAEAGAAAEGAAEAGESEEGAAEAGAPEDGAAAGVGAADAGAGAAGVVKSIKVSHSSSVLQSGAASISASVTSVPVTLAKTSLT